VTQPLRPLLRHPAGLLATGFGSGLSPVAPGTVGSAVAILPWFAMRELPPLIYAAAMVSAFALGVWACTWAVRQLKSADPGAIVWDEFVGQWLALTPLVIAPRAWPWILAGFILFRICDIVKPWPASWADRQVKGGVGVMLDDAIAAAYAAILLALALHFL
jgi:phosphatidylglycerophosphatase A